MAFDLYQKYIKSAAKYQINIKSETFKTLNNYMNDINIWLKINITENALVYLYNNCCKEMLKLLRYSLNRACNIVESFESISQIKTLLYDL